MIMLNDSYFMFTELLCVDVFEGLWYANTEVRIDKVVTREERAEYIRFIFFIKWEIF